MKWVKTPRVPNDGNVDEEACGGEFEAQNQGSPFTTTLLAAP